MDTNQSILQRRSVKHYDTDFLIPKNEMDEILDLAIHSPSSFNIQHWRIVNIVDTDIRKNIRAAAWDQAQVTEASHLFAICADVKAFEKSPEEYWRDADKAVQDMIVPMIGTFYEGNDQLQRDEALRSVGIISQTLMLAVKSYGYDSCPMIGFDPEKVASEINLPKDHIIGMLIAVGKAKQPAKPRSGIMSKQVMIVENKFN